MSGGAQDPVALTLALCRVESTTGAEAAVMALAGELCAAQRLTVRTQPVGHPQRVNVLAVDEAVAPRVLLTTHLDTVPPYFPPVDELDRLTGRGTCDAKGAAAAMMCAVAALRAQGERRVGLLFVVGEEGPSDGARAAVQGFAPQVDAFINGEPTGLALMRAQKGTLTFTLRAHGVACHSAYPELGHSAIHALIPVLQHLLSEPWPQSEGLGDTTVNLGLLSGGVATNVLAPQAQAQGIFRLAVPVAAVEARLRALMGPHVDLDVTGSNDPVVFHVPPGERGEVARFGSDVPYLKVLGKPLMLGPGSIHDAHTSHEHVLKADLHAAVTRYIQLARLLLPA